MVYTQAPAPAGRGKRTRRTPVHDKALELGLDVVTPDRLDEPVVNGFKRLDPDLAVLIAYGKLIPATMLEVPRWGFLNVHPSLLPRWRGAAPIQRAIMAGDSQTGVCIIRVNEEFDAGPIMACSKEEVLLSDTAGTLSVRLAMRGADLLLGVIHDLDGIVPRSQPEGGITHAAKIHKPETRLDWSLPAADVDAVIRGLSPVPGAWSCWSGKRTGLMMSMLVDGAGPPGTVLDERLTVACGTGAVRILTIRSPSGKIMDGDSFMRGYGKSDNGRFE